MIRIHRAALFATLALLLIPAAQAKVASQSSAGFQSSHELEVPIDPAAAYRAFVEVGRWWSDAHTFSGAAKNLSLDAKAGGCWCETLPNGGSVRHMVIVHANPGTMLVFNGGLGPLQFMGVAGSMQVTFRAKDSGTQVSITYSVGGYNSAGFQEIAKAVDAVLSEQVKRYGNFAATGKP